MCSKNPPSADADFWYSDEPEDKIVFSLELEQRCWVESLELTVVGASHVEVRGAPDSETLWRDARRMVARTQIRDMYSYKNGAFPECKISLAPAADAMGLSYNVIFIALINHWDPLCRVGLRKLRIHGVPDDANDEHPPLPLRAGSELHVYNPHVGLPEAVLLQKQQSQLVGQGSILSQTPMASQMKGQAKHVAPLFEAKTKKTEAAPLPQATEYQMPAPAPAVPTFKTHYNPATPVPSSLENRKVRPVQAGHVLAPESQTLLVGEGGGVGATVGVGGYTATVAQTPQVGDTLVQATPIQETLVQATPMQQTLVSQTLVQGGAGPGCAPTLEATLAAPTAVPATPVAPSAKPLLGVTVCPNPPNFFFFFLIFKKQVCLSGFVNPERSELRTTALALGAVFTEDFSKGGTHLVCAFANTPKVREVRLSGRGFIVTKEWLHTAKSTMMRPPEASFTTLASPTNSPQKKRRRTIED